MINQLASPSVCVIDDPDAPLKAFRGQTRS
jgi:hypothetical protein